MAIRQLTEDMSIISALSDEPNDIDGLSSAELKAKFDSAGTIIKEYVNSSLIPDVEEEIVKVVSDTVVQSGNMPAGGSQGQTLVKRSDESFDWEFKTLVDIPSGGVKGQVLTKGSDEDYDARFEDVPKLPLDWQLLASYSEAGTYTWEAPDIYADGLPYEIGAFIIGAGASGPAGVVAVSQSGAGSGGASGYTKAPIVSVAPGSLHNIVVGLKGAAVTGNNNGQNGGSSSFDGNVALGGDGGSGGRGASGGQGSDAMNLPASDFPTQAPAMGRSPMAISSGTNYTRGGLATPTMCFNPFDKKRYLGAGGGACIAYIGNYTGSAQSVVVLDDGLSAGAGAYAINSNAVGGNATSPGSGGGAAITTYGYTATSGEGADGAVFIYVRRPVR